jgi:sensor histidine kinase regulating citrate/malate metabolism
MALVKEIIESHQGNIYFITEKNVGTTFFVKIPQGKKLEQNTDFSI